MTHKYTMRELDLMIKADPDRGSASLVALAVAAGIPPDAYHRYIEKSRAFARERDLEVRKKAESLLRSHIPMPHDRIRSEAEAHMAVWESNYWEDNK